MDEIIKRHASDFDEVYEIVHAIDLIKQETTYRVEILRRIETGYRTRFTARYFKKEMFTAFTRNSASPSEGSSLHTGEEIGHWIALHGVTPNSDSARDALNQALIWLGIYVRKQAMLQQNPTGTA